MSNNNQPQIIQATALPIHQPPTVTVINTGFNNTSPPIQFQLAFSYSKTIKLFTAIEAFFLFIYGFYFPFYFFQAIGPLIGYIGAKNFYKNTSISYFIYLSLSIISKIFIVGFTFQDHIQNPLLFLITVLSFIFDFWLLKITFKFIQILKNISQENLIRLRNLHLVSHYVYW